ncbi:hypothetical protein ACRRTK_008801 [Alexandromys fortis]
MPTEPAETRLHQTSAGPRRDNHGRYQLSKGTQVVSDGTGSITVSANIPLLCGLCMIRS